MYTWNTGCYPVVGFNHASNKAKHYTTTSIQAWSKPSLPPLCPPTRPFGASAKISMSLGSTMTWPAALSKIAASSEPNTLATCLCTHVRFLHRTLWSMWHM